MTRKTQFLLVLTLAAVTARPAAADDKDFLRPLSDRVPPNLFIVFGNSQTMTQTFGALTGAPMSTWDGDADSPSSKLGSGKIVIRQFISDFRATYNIGLTAFARPPNFGSTTINRKHWVYQSLDPDFPNDSFVEPAGTLERWGPFGEGPCTSKTVPTCSASSPSYINFVAPYANGTATFSGNIFFGANPAATTYAYVLLDGTSVSGATKRIRMSITSGKYGDAFTDGTLASLTLGGSPGTHSIEVTKEYQTCGGSCNNSLNWHTQPLTPGNSPGTVVVRYRPPVTFPASSFYPTGATNRTGGSIAGRYVGFLSDPVNDFSMNSNCSGLEFQNTGDPLIKIPRDYYWGQACNPPQDSFGCVKRLLRPQAYVENYDTTNGTFNTNDPDNPGYTQAGLSKYADGCDPNVMGTVQDGLDSLERQVILTAKNGSQAPIKDALDNIYDYFSNPAIDGFQNGVRNDDPNKVCRNTAVIFVYDTFNGCQNDSCSFLKSHQLTRLKSIGVPVYTIGFGASATSGICAGATPPEGCPLVCIPKYSGAFKADGTTPAYFPVTDGVSLYNALASIADLVNESQKGFVSSTVSTAQASGEQVTFLATFNALNKRSIWNGRVNAYKLDSAGNLQLGVRTIRDPNDPNNGITVPAPLNTPGSLMWNAGENLADTPAWSGAPTTGFFAILPPLDPIQHSVYTDSSNDSNQDIATNFYSGRKVVFSLPQGYSAPTALPIPASDIVPETRLDMVSPPLPAPFTTPPSWWPTLKALLSPQGAPSPPAVAIPTIADDDAANSLRFIWGDRDTVITAIDPSATGTALYNGLKLGDIFHSSPVLVGPPNQFAYFSLNLHGYQDFRTTYQHRRRVLYFGANDGLFHGVDAGGWDRTPALCDLDTDGVTRKHCFDLGSGAEIFAYAPRATMQIFKKLKDRVGVQTPRMEWTVDGPATAGDVFIDADHSGSPDDTHRAWHTILVGGMREGSPFEGTSGATPSDSQGSYYALDVTQPDALTADTNGKPLTIIPATFNAPKCLNANADLTCGKDAADSTVRGFQPARAYPTVLWEIADVGDLEAGVTGAPGAGYVDMGETWSKPALGRVRVCVTGCGTQTPTNEDHYVAIFGGGFDRERRNRRGNWLYMVDVETGKVLYRANSSCGINDANGTCTPTYFASIPSEPAAIDGNGDGLVDLIFVGDLNGRMWRIDTTDLRLFSSPPTGRFENKIDVGAGGTGKPFLLFEAPQPAAGNIHPFYPIYYRPTVISLGYNVGGKPAVGVAFGTGDRDDITANLQPQSLTYKQRFYYVVDRNNQGSPLHETPDLLDITSPTAAGVTTAPVNGWFLELNLGERVNADMLTVGGVIFFTTFNPLAAGNPTNTCAQNSPDCGLANGTARLYRVFYSTGNPYLGSDRGETQQFGGFLSEPVYFQAQDQSGNVIYTTENTVKKETAPGGKKTAVKSWKERSRRP
jgi:Tfp pilus tip-associated adhesin PilY1